MTKSANHVDILVLTSDIVSSYVSNNKIAQNDLDRLIRDIHATLCSLEMEPSAPIELQPAVPIEQSVTADHIVCLEDGKKLKTLKRHLKAAFNMSPEEYRQKWGLPTDYPMVARNYAKKRSTLAKKIGLGRKAGQWQSSP